jgi:hypothetical protein
MADLYDTLRKMPRPKRPLNGLLAWQATIGYISLQYSPDALLKLQVYPLPEGARWSASASWGQQEEQVRDLLSLPAALRDLWQEVDQHHHIFQSEEDAVRGPVDYEEHQWVDPRTHETLTRLIRVTQAVFPNDWQLIVAYQPIETSSTRVQARLLARNSKLQVGGRGPTVRDACHDLYTNAAPLYANAAAKREESE